MAGDVAGNLRAHAGLVSLAASRGARLVFFPELSLTGYEPALAARLAVDPGDPLPDSLLGLQAQADAKGIVIAVGLPTRAPDGIQITMAMLRPGASPGLYSKQWLHADELPYFVPGRGQAILRAHGHSIAPAICYESLLPEHASGAAALGADVYLASVAKAAHQLPQAFAHFPAVARRHRMTVLMANCVGPCHDFAAAGGSAAWNVRGELLARMDGDGEGLVLVDIATGVAEVLGAQDGA